MCVCVCVCVCVSAHLYKVYEFEIKHVMRPPSSPDPEEPLAEGAQEQGPGCPPSPHVWYSLQYLRPAGQLPSVPCEDQTASKGCVCIVQTQPSIGSVIL